MVPGGLESFAPDAAFEGYFLFEQVEGDAVEQQEVLCGMSRAFSIEVFASNTCLNE